MDVLIKLKDCDLVRIESNNDYFQERRDYYDDEKATYWYGKFRFTFKEPKYGIEYCSCVRTDCGEYYLEEMDFTYIASFFYGKDFSEMTSNEFTKSFTKYVHGEEIKEDDF
jgi:hypothetical protein